MVPDTSRSTGTGDDGVKLPLSGTGYCNNDRKADIAVWRPGNGAWYLRGQAEVALGTSGEVFFRAGTL